MEAKQRSREERASPGQGFEGLWLSGQLAPVSPVAPRLHPHSLQPPRVTSE